MFAALWKSMKNVQRRIRFLTASSRDTVESTEIDCVWNSSIGRHECLLTHQSPKRNVTLRTFLWRSAFSLLAAEPRGANMEIRPPCCWAWCLTIFFRGVEIFNTSKCRYFLPCRSTMPRFWADSWTCWRLVRWFLIDGGVA